MRLVYSLLVRLAAAPALLVLLARGLRDRAYWQGLGERFGYGARLAPGPRIWLHAVSLGEVSAAAPIVRGLQARYPGVPIVVTTATPTGRSRAQALFGGDDVGAGRRGAIAGQHPPSAVDVRFLPYDLPGAIARFLTRTAPRMAVIMETELWPNLYRACAERGLPLVLANARLSEKSVSRYRRCGGLFRDLFTPNVWVAAQTTIDAGRFQAIGAEPARLRVVGNVKFDLEIGPEILARGTQLREMIFRSRPVWVAGSTHEGEESEVLDAQARIAKMHPDAVLILAPRHPQRFDAVADLLTRRGLAFVRRSAGAALPAATGVLLLDTVGELLPFYAAADLAFVGGSLVAIGGHNLLEPAALGRPVLTGPYDFNAPQLARLLVQAGAVLRIQNGAQLAAAVNALLADPAERSRVGTQGRQAVEANRGSTARLLELIAEQWPPTPARAGESIDH
jgi:3-deoxy-D-manno-octulosonic-acid transferase